MGYEIENKIESEEGLSADEAKVRELLGGLKRVEAPKDFGFKVQARIANAKPEEYRETAGSWVFLRYAAPLALVLVVASAFVISGIYGVNDETVPAVAISTAAPESKPLEPPPAIKEGDIPIPANNDLRGNSNSETVKKPGEELLAVTNRQVERKPTDPANKGGGYVDRTQEAPRPFFELPGATPRSQSNNIETPGQIPVEEILKFVGINSTFTDRGWRVNSVQAHSVSERSGVRRGDLIEAINGQPVTQGTRFSGTFNGKSVRVKRDGKILEIDLR